MPAITVIAHNIRSTHNVGAIFRSCEGFGVRQLVLSGYTPYPTLPDDTRLPHIRDKITAQIHKTALGAETLVQFVYTTDLEQWLAATELPLLALEQAADSQDIRHYQPPAAFALLLGEEVAGIAPELLAKARDVVEIPMHGQKESFNVSVACGIALYALTSAPHNPRQKA